MIILLKKSKFKTMNNTAKKRFLIIVIIVLIIINVSALVTIYYNSKIKVKRINETNLQKEEIRKMGMYHFLKDELNLSENQFEEFKSANQEYILNTQNISTKLSNYRHLLIREIANKNPNKENIDSISRQIGNLHYDLKLITSDHFLDLKEICNDDQQESLQHLFIRMISIQDKEPRRNEHRRQHKERPHRRRGKN